MPNSNLTVEAPINGRAYARIEEENATSGMSIFFTVHLGRGFRSPFSLNSPGDLPLRMRRSRCG